MPAGSLAQEEIRPDWKCGGRLMNSEDTLTPLEAELRRNVDYLYIEDFERPLTGLFQMNVNYMHFEDPESLERTRTRLYSLLEVRQRIRESIESLEMNFDFTSDRWPITETQDMPQRIIRQRRIVIDDAERFERNFAFTSDRWPITETQNMPQIIIQESRIEIDDYPLKIISTEPDIMVFGCEVPSQTKIRLNVTSPRRLDLRKRAIFASNGLGIT